MASPLGGRHRTTRQYSAEDQVLNQINSEAEDRLAQRRQARAEAREIRIRELRKQQKDMEDKQDKIYELTKESSSTPRGYTGSRRGSDDSTSSEDTRELKKQNAELEDKYKKAMMTQAQLDNEKQTYRHQVDLLKDQIEDLEESHVELQREHKDRCRELDQLKRDFKDLELESGWLKQQLHQRDELIQQYGLVFISNEAEEEEEENKKGKKKRRKKKEDEKPGTSALVTKDALEILAQHPEGNLDEKLKQFATEKEELQETIKQLKLKLEESEEKAAIAEKYASPKRGNAGVTNGPSDSEIIESQMESQKVLSDYKFKLKKAEQDITMLEGNVIRLESQVKRYKTAAESGETKEEELKGEKRKLQRELRDSQSEIADLQSQNQHLNKRLEKLKATRREVY